MKILCIGQAAFDLTFPIEEPLQENRKYVVSSHKECVGAPATNAAALLAKWGLDTSLIARIGSDLYGKRILNTLKDTGLNTQYIQIEEGISTSLSCILSNIKTGTRTILNDPLLAPERLLPFPDTKPDYILIDGRESLTAKTVLEKFPDSISIMDAGSLKPWTKSLAGRIDYFVCSEDLSRSYTQREIDLKDLSGLETIFHKLEELTKNTIVITIGQRGLLYKSHGQIRHIPAYPAKTVDSTGAGDIFHGAFVYFLAQKMPLIEVLKMASLTASISTETIGGMPSIPSLETVYERKSRIEGFANERD